MATIYSSPPKYHPNEWHSSNSQNFKQSEKERISSERLRAECERLRKETEDTTRRTQRDVEHKFSQRINNINFWKEELEAKLNATVAEIGAVLDYKAQLEQALQSTSFPLEVAKSCLVFREKRVGIDLVHDEVEIQLMKVSFPKCYVHNTTHVIIEAVKHMYINYNVFSSIECTILNILM